MTPRPAPRPPGPDPPTTRTRVVDTTIALAVVAALWLRAAAPFEREAVPPDWRAWVVIGLLGAVLLVRRRWPIRVLVASVVLLLAYYMMGFGAVGAIWPLVVPLFTVAEQGHWRWGAATGGALLVGSAIVRLTIERETLTAGTLADILNEVVLLAAILLAGAMVRNHRALQAASLEREAALKAEAAAQQATRLTGQRLAIARDVHDVVAHALAGIGVQARLAVELLDDDPAQARPVVTGIGTVTRDALADLRRTVGGLRGPPPRDGLEELVRRTDGVDVQLSRPTPPDGPDQRLEGVVVAIVREALTNVVRHAGAGTARVLVDDRADATTVRIVDDGVGGPFVEGHGLTGMRERLVEVGGRLEVSAPPAGGFELVAVVPRSAVDGRDGGPGASP